MLNLLVETVLFVLVMVVASFGVSYLTDMVRRREVDWWPDHAWGMISGLALTSIIVYVSLSKTYLRYKCN